MEAPLEPGLEAQPRRPLKRAVLAAVLFTLALIAVSVARHPASTLGDGGPLLWIDVALLLAYGIAALCVARLYTLPELDSSLSVGSP